MDWRTGSKKSNEESGKQWVVEEGLKLRLRSLNISKEQMEVRRKVEMRRSLKILKKTRLTGQDNLRDMKSDGEAALTAKARGARTGRKLHGVITQKN